MVVQCSGRPILGLQPIAEGAICMTEKLWDVTRICQSLNVGVMGQPVRVASALQICIIEQLAPSFFRSKRVDPAPFVMR